MIDPRQSDSHTVLDELVAIFLTHNPGVLPSQVSLLDFWVWSHRQSCHREEGVRFLA